MPLSNRELEEVRSNLRINEDEIDRALAEHSEWFRKAGDHLNEVTADHDTLKLELKELVAELDGQIRKNAVEVEEKLTETQLNNRIQVLPRVKDLNRKILAAKKRMDDASTLKESYQQRSFMLRGMNDSANARLYNMGIERGAASARMRIGERNHERLERQRNENDRGMFENRDGSTPRYRKRDQGD